MEQTILEEVERVIDVHFPTEDLNDMLKRFVRDKAQENSDWAEITRSCHHMLGGKSPHIGQISALTEMIILSLDIVDDLQDKDNLTKSWMSYPPEMTLNAIISLIFSAIAELGRLSEADIASKLPRVDDVGRYLTRSINGQHKDLKNAIVTEDDYFSMVHEKSGSLLRFACYMGYACHSGCDRATAGQIDELAGYIGIIAQLENDIKDILRYDVKNDLLEKKKTLPILFLLQHCREEFPVLHQYYDGAMTSAEFLRYKRECLQYITDSGCIEYCKVVQSLYVNRAEQLLDRIPAVSPWKERFKEATFASFSKSALSYIEER